jgi:hypothetical protein
MPFTSKEIMHHVSLYLSANLSRVGFTPSGKGDVKMVIDELLRNGWALPTDCGGKDLAWERLSDDLLITVARSMGLSEKAVQARIKALCTARRPKGKAKAHGKVLSQKQIDNNERRKELLRREQQRAIWVKQALFDRTQALTRRITAVPGHGRERMRALVALQDDELSILINAGVISHDEHREIKIAKKTSVTLYRLAQILGVRGMELRLWDTDGRLPHSHEAKLRKIGGVVSVKVWLAADVEYAEERYRSWIREDMASGYLRFVGVRYPQTEVGVNHPALKGEACSGARLQIK